jgi:hypothetical protein
VAYYVLMELQSTKRRFRILTCVYALGLFVLFLFGASEDVGSSVASSGVLVWVPIGLTVLLLVGQTLVSQRELAIIGVGRKATKPGYMWLACLLVYAVTTWIAFRLDHLNLVGLR